MLQSGWGVVGWVSWYSGRGGQSCTSGQIKDQSPLRDAVPGPFTDAVLVAEERRLDARSDAVQAMLANLGRSGALIVSSVDSRDNRIDQLDESSPGGSHEVAFGRGQQGLAG